MNEEYACPQGHRFDDREKLIAHQVRNHGMDEHEARTRVYQEYPLPRREH